MSALRLAVARGPIAVLTIVALVACGSSGNEPGGTASWGKVAPPIVTDSTNAVIVTDGSLADGRYWASISRVSGTGDLVFTVSRAWFGEACAAWATERGMEQGCMNDYAVDDIDTALVAMAPDATVSVAAPMGPGTNYSIDTATLEGLVAGSVVSPVATYQWTGFPFVVTVSDGVVTSADQHWVP